MSVVPDRAALAVHIDALEEGDHVAVATADGVVSGELVDKDAADVVIDQPLVQGGAERIVVPRREIQAIRYQQSSAPTTRIPVKALVTVAVVVGLMILAVTLIVPSGP